MIELVIEHTERATIRKYIVSVSINDSKAKGNILVDQLHRIARWYESKRNCIIRIRQVVFGWIDDQVIYSKMTARIEFDVEVRK